MASRFWQGMERATGNLANTGMRLMEFQAGREDAAQRMALEGDRMKLLQDAAMREKTAFQHAEKQRLEQERMNEAYVPASMVAKNIHQTPKLKAMFTETLKSAGFDLREMPDGEVYLPNKAARFIGNLMQTQTTFQKQALDATLADLSDQSAAIGQKIAELQASGKTDKKTLGPLVQQLQGIKTQIGTILTADVGLQKQLALEQAKAKDTSMTDELKEYRFAVQQGEKRSFTDWKNALKKSGATNISVTNKVGQESMAKLGEEMSKDLVSMRKDVEGAVSSLNNLKEAEKLINAGVITGTGADYLVNMGNFLSSRLGVNLAKDPVENTQAYASTMGNQVGQIIKQFGSGTGLSDADREYAEKIVGGKITLTEGAIRKLMAINKKAFTNVVKNYNKRAEQAMKKPGADQLPYDLRIEYNFGGEGAQDDMAKFWKK